MTALVSDHGIDTVRFRWRDDNLLYRQWQRRPEGTIEGYRGERFTQTPLGRIGVYPDGLTYFEGRASAILHLDPDNHDLMAVDAFTPAEQVAVDYVREAGAPVSDGARLGRVDLASELRFSDAYEGSAFLHSLAALDVPWCKSRTDGRKGDHIETVSFHGTQGKTIYLRAYDKGVESGTAGPGLRIRVERQKRFRKDREQNVSMFAASDVRSLFVGREFAKLTNLPNALVCDVPEALSALCEVAPQAGWSDRKIEMYAGYLVIGHFLDYERATFYRRAAELRDLGIFVDPTQIERLEVPVGRYLQALASAWAA